MVCVFPDDVCPYAKIVPLYPPKTSKATNKAGCKNPVKQIGRMFFQIHQTWS